MTEHAADLLNKFHVGVDGRTAYRRHKGKEFRGATVEFGEKVHYRRHVEDQLRTNKMDPRWAEGFHLGRD